MRLLRVVFINLIATILARENTAPKVSTPLGEILGSTLTTRLGKTIYAFRAIRYAEPPVAELRFKPPVPTGRWKGVYNATTDGPVCPQPTQRDRISEDCLFLNVYTTQLQAGHKNPKRPVIVYLHAGGYYSGTGSSAWIGPQYFLDQDIVLVTFNYRLASLGFISTGEDAPGNNGLKDQVLALKWIRSNIESFGGDPDSVTLFGYSAGAFSITLHLVSPMSRGLFHKAILGSGSILGQWNLPHHQLDLARKQARLVGCPDDVSPKKIIECLRKVPAEDLGNSLQGFEEFGDNPIIAWWPVIEEDFGQERFLAEDPYKTYERGDFPKIPVVAGITKDEFGYQAFQIIENKTLLTKLNDNFEKYAPIPFLYERGTTKSREASAALRKFYLGEQPLSNNSFQGLNKLFADSIIGFPVNRAVNVISAKGCAVYYYEFTYQGRFSHFNLPNSQTSYSVVHHDDLIYLFYISPLFPFFNSSYPEREMVEKLTTLWATFAETGNPIPQSSPLFRGVEWKTFNNGSKKYLDIGSKISLKERLHEERYNFWNELFPVPSFAKKN